MADTVEMMRKRVLDLAIRGELVEQRPEEGTAEELLNQIRDEQLISKSEYGTVKDGPFELPENWKWVSLGEVINFQNGYAFKSNSYVDNGIKVVRIGDIVDGVLNEETMRSIPTGIANDLSDNLFVSPGDFVIAMSGATTGKLGFNTSTNKYLLNQRVGKITPIIVNKYYIFNLLETLVEVNLKKSMGSAIPNLSTKQIMNIQVPLPPLAEQSRIVDKTKEIFAVIDQIGTKKEEALTIIQNMRQTALQEAIMGVLVEQDETDEPASELYEKIKNEKEFFIKSGKNNQEKLLPEIDLEEIPFEIPNNWKWVRLGEVGQTNIGLTYKPTDKSEDGTIVLRSSNIQNGKMDYSDIVRVDLNIPEAKKCEIGDLLICARNGSKRLVGKAALVDEEGHSFGAFMANYRSEFNQYIYYYMRSNFFRSLLGESGTTTINQITQSMLKGFILPLPPFAEQERIVRKLDEIMTICDQMEAILD